MTALYRHFDADGALLYVGITIRPLQRMCEHKKVSSWFDDIARVDIQRHPDRKAAMVAEVQAIRREKPKYNIQHNLPPPLKTAHEDAKVELLNRTVNFKPLYSLREAAKQLGMNEPALKKLCINGTIGSIELSRKPRPHHKAPGGTVDVVKRAITGWQIIEYIEYMEEKSKALTSGTDQC